MTPPNLGGELERRHFKYLSLESSCSSGEYNPLTGETDPPHYPELPAGHEMQRDFTSPLSHGSPGEHHHNERYDGEFSADIVCGVQICP